jgi:hypothetical protein
MREVLLFDKGLDLYERHCYQRDSGLIVSRFRPFDTLDMHDQLAFADFLGFNAGRIIAENSGWPASSKFDLSTRPISACAATDAYAARAPITGTGYAQATQATPTATAGTLGQKAFTVLSWATGAAVDWTNPCSIVCSDGSSLIAAWNLVPGGAAQVMSAANTTINVTPTYLPTNPP